MKNLGPRSRRNLRSAIEAAIDNQISLLRGCGCSGDIEAALTRDDVARAAEIAEWHNKLVRFMELRQRLFPKRGRR